MRQRVTKPRPDAGTEVVVFIAGYPTISIVSEARGALSATITDTTGMQHDVRWSAGSFSTYPAPRFGGLHGVRTLADLVAEDPAFDVVEIRRRTARFAFLAAVRKISWAVATYVSKAGALETARNDPAFQALETAVEVAVVVMRDALDAYTTAKEEAEKCTPVTSSSS